MLLVARRAHSPRHLNKLHIRHALTMTLELRHNLVADQIPQHHCVFIGTCLTIFDGGVSGAADLNCVLFIRTHIEQARDNGQRCGIFSGLLFLVLLLFLADAAKHLDHLLLLKIEYEQFMERQNQCMGASGWAHGFLREESYLHDSCQAVCWLYSKKKGEFTTSISNLLTYGLNNFALAARDELDGAIGQASGDLSFIGAVRAEGHACELLFIFLTISR